MESGVASGALTLLMGDGPVQHKLAKATSRYTSEGSMTDMGTSTIERSVGQRGRAVPGARVVLMSRDTWESRIKFFW